MSGPGDRSSVEVSAAPRSRAAEDSIAGIDDTIALLRDLPRVLQPQVMIPFSPVAFFEGYLHHTNELLCLVGDGVFVKKTSASAIAMLERRKEFVRGLADLPPPPDAAVAAVPSKPEGPAIEMAKMAPPSAVQGSSTLRPREPILRTNPDGTVEIMEFLDEVVGGGGAVAPLAGATRPRPPLPPPPPSAAAAAAAPDDRPTSAVSSATGSKRLVDLATGLAVEPAAVPLPAPSSSAQDSTTPMPSTAKQSLFAQRLRK